jgi:3'-phosphoadenosine 5'-phosphosulfate sulfotransferase (PAPS reductase)/FAD synthetase
MNEVVCYSMGICSAYIAARLQDECQKPICVFSDTKREDVDTYRFGHEVAERWQLNLTEASRGEDLWEYFRKSKMIPARQISSCSRVFKIEPFQQWLSTQEPSQVSYGYDVTEEDRMEKMIARWPFEQHKPRFPLIEWGITKEECFGYFLKHGIEPPRIYDHFNHANCLPCKNFREPDWKALQYHYPAIFEEAKAFETGNGLRWMQDGPLLIELPVLNNPPSRKGRRKLSGNEPRFNFDMGCERCAID